MRFEPLSADSSVSCALLEINGCRILLDCGWSEPYDTTALDPLRKVAASVNIVLLSHPDLAHVGALPYAVAHFGLKATILCTLPVSKMSQMFLYDTVISYQEIMDFGQMTLDTIDAISSRLITLKYHQEHTLEEYDLVFCASNSGRMVGGTVWRISKGVHDVIYAVDYNHQREKHLNRFQFEAFGKPSLFITDSRHISRSETDTEKRNATFLWTILQTVRNSGNVLIPTDTAGRVLELIQLLEEYWIKNKLTFPLLFLGPVSFSTVSFASCQLEWMQTSITDTFEKDRDNPFDCRCFLIIASAVAVVDEWIHMTLRSHISGHVCVRVQRCLRFCHTHEDFEKVGDDPKVVLATHPSLEAGFARQLAVDWIEEEKNKILLTERPRTGSLVFELFNRSEEKSQEKITVRLTKRVPLTGEELEAYEKCKDQKVKGESAVDTDIDGDIDKKSEFSSATEGVDIDKSGKAMTGENQSPNNVTKTSFRAEKLLSLDADSTRTETRHVYLSGILVDGFDVPQNALNPMFPFDKEDEHPWTVYGEDIDAKTFIPAHPSKEDAALSADAALIEEEEVEVQPTKIVGENRLLSVTAPVQLFDMSGYTNRHFMTHIVTYLQPHNLILINGDSNDQNEFREMTIASCPYLKGGDRVHTTTVGNAIELQESLDGFSIVVNKRLIKSAEWKSNGQTRLTWIKGRVCIDDASSNEVLKLEPIDEENDKKESVFVGVQRLSQIKAAIAMKEMETEFVNGCLIVNKSVRVRFAPSGQLEIEGPTSLDYYLVRKTIDEIYKIK